MASPERSLWKYAINEEFNTLELYAKWNQIKAPSGTRPLPTGAVLKLKIDAAGRPERFKARLVTHGKL